MIKATDRKLVVGLEIGTAKVAALVGEVLPDGMVNIIGVGSCPSRGMDKGGVNDLESVVKCVQRAIDQAELMADCQISSVYLALSGKHISCQNEIGMVPISEEEVTQEDVENVVHTAKSVRVRDEQTYRLKFTKARNRISHYKKQICSATTYIHVQHITHITYCLVVRCF